MRTLNILRNLIILLFCCAAAASASATEAHARPHKKIRQQPHHASVQAPRKEAAAFVDPTLPLAAFVERLRQQQAH